MAGVIFKTKFLASSAKAYAGYVDYIDRDEAIRNQAFKEYNAFAGYNEYMDDPEKTTGLFTANKDRLSQEEKKELKAQYSAAQEKGGLMHQSIFSFETEWLKETGLSDSDGNINEDAFRTYTRQAIATMLKEEGMSGWTWSAAVHYNTNHTHIHIAVVDPSPSWKEGEGRCKRDKSTGELYQRGKLKGKTLEKVKARFINLALDAEKSNKLLNEIVRERILAGKSEISFHHNKDELQKGLENLMSKLPSDMRLWKYNMAAMDEFRPEIDALSKAFIEKYFSDDIQAFNDEVDRLSNQYKKSYGDSKKGTDFVESKQKDLYSRLGNAILSECRKVESQHRQKNQSTQRAKSPLRYYMKNHQKSMRGAINNLKQAMKKDIQQMKNQAAYEHLLKEMDHDL